MAAKHMVREDNIALNLYGASYFTGIINLLSRIGVECEGKYERKTSREGLLYTICIDPHKNSEIVGQTFFIVLSMKNWGLWWWKMRSDARKLSCTGKIKLWNLSFTPLRKYPFLPFLCCQQSMISYISETKHLNLIFVQLDELYDPSNTKYYKELNHRTIISKTLGP